jgi:O-antigen/teichoic acid export membrane protein
LWPYAIAVAAFTLLTQADVVLVKMLFPPDSAGVYAAASTGGKIVLYLTAPVAMVMLPEAVRRHSHNDRQLSALLRSAMCAALPGAALVAVYALLPRPIIRVLFGTGYTEGGPLLWLVGLGMLGYELALLGVYYLLGAGQRAVLRVVVVQAVLYMLALSMLAHSLETVAALVAATGLVACAGVWWHLLPRPTIGTVAAGTFPASTPQNPQGRVVERSRMRA